MSKASAKTKARPRKSVERFTWHGIEMSATHSPDYISAGWSHLELRVLKPKGRPVPITDTGYLSHFLDEDDLKAAGGPAAFFLAWLEREASSKAYKLALARWQQLDLFAKR
jgi:hypothetical protein